MTDSRLSTNHAEHIARVVKHMRNGNVTVTEKEVEAFGYVAGHHPVIDVTPIYDDFVRSGKDIAWAMYEDTVARPPFVAALYAFVNVPGNVVVLTSNTIDQRDWPIDVELRWATQADDHVIEWDRVRWVTAVGVYLGGYSQTRQAWMPTTGPMVTLRLAIYDDGELADITWMDIAGHGIDQWTNVLVTYLKAVTMMNCRNVEALPPTRDRKTQRRIDRHGVDVRELHIVPMGKYRRNEAPRRVGGGDTPLSTVRGHVARYGPKYGRGLLFGKYECEVWITPHLRGTGDAHEQRYVTEVER